MTIEALKKRLDDLSWQEQMDFELSERGGDPLASVDESIQALAAELDAGLLEMLEQEDGYMDWALRLGVYVRGYDPLRPGGREAEKND